MDKKIKPGMWMVFYDEYAESNIMVKVISVDTLSNTATVYMDLAAKKTDNPVPYESDISLDKLKFPAIKIKKNKKQIEK